LCFLCLCGSIPMESKGVLRRMVGVQRKRKIMNHRLWIILPGFFILMMGCMHSLERGKPFVREKALSGIKRIAVLPFYNLSDRVDAEVLVTNIYIGEVVNDQRYATVKYGDIREFLLKHRILTTETITREILQRLADTFFVDGVMLGTIFTYQEWDPDNEKEPAVVDVSVRLLECESGRIIWCGREKRTGWDERKVFDIGEVVFCSQLVQKTAQNFLQELSGG